MQGKFKYRECNVHDIPVGDMTVRLWSASGQDNRKAIEKAFSQLARSGFVYPYAALMPDWHPGDDAVVGSVVPTREVLLPGIIGGDIGCGMIATQLPCLIDDITPRLQEIAAKLHSAIPTGTEHNAIVSHRVALHPLWKKELRAPVSSRTLRKLVRQFGSLGGGNHFLEIQKDHHGFIWIMLHSGSRYLGVQVRDWYVDQGTKLRDTDRNLYSKIPYLPAADPVAQDYLADMETVREFAGESRREMMIRALEVFGSIIPGLDINALLMNSINVGHNYIGREEHFGELLYVHRKGAICLKQGERGLVPGSMGTSSYVVEGRGNEFGFNSCAHGGGRKMSRAAASRQISERDFRESMKGVVYEHNSLLLDEAPDAYKNIKVVMRGQSDLVKIIHEVRPIISVKGR